MEAFRLAVCFYSCKRRFAKLIRLFKVNLGWPFKSLGLIQQ